MSNIEEIVKEINENGYYILKNYIEKEKINKIIHHINNNKIQLTNDNHLKHGGGDYRCKHFEKCNNTALEFLNDNFILNIGSKFLGHQVDRKKKRCQLGILKNNNNNESSGGGWHVDNHNPQFKALLYLTDVSINNGPFAIISPPITSKDYTPISSNEDTRFPDEIVKHYKNNTHILTGNSGDVILVNTQNIHRGTIIKEGIRMSLTNYYYD